MFITGQEIYAQGEALIKTEEYLLEKRDEIKNFFHDNKHFIFIGCGSSFMLSKTGENLFSTLHGVSSSVIAGGDYIIDPEWYREMIEDSIVIAISRSGATTEILRAVSLMKKVKGVRVMSLTMQEGNELAAMSDLNLDMPWAFDHSVCQTRTVSNFYEVLVALRCFYVDDQNMLDDLSSAVHNCADFQKTNKEKLAKIAGCDFDNVVVLADGGLCGVAEEGSLAFTEISIIGGKYFHILDYRHGPIVLNGEKTLTIVALRPDGNKYQDDMIRDLKSRKCILLVLDNQREDIYGVNCHLFAGGMKNYISYGLPLVTACQMIAYHKAEKSGINPDNPNGITAFVELK